MKKFLSLLTLLGCSLFANGECCPKPPPGYDCPEEPLAILPGSAQIATTNYVGETDVMIWQTRVTRYIAIVHPAVVGHTYEIQYTDSLTAPVWKAYARWTDAFGQVTTTHVPVYPCVPQRFFRVCAAAP